MGRARVAPLCAAAAPRCAAHRARPLHRGTERAQHRHIGALHPDPPASVLPRQVRVSGYGLPGRVRQLPADDQSAAQPALERSGRGRRDRGRAGRGRDIPAMTRAKRVFDLAAAAVGLMLVSPLLIILALLIKAEDGGPAFFRHQRVGHRGRPFRMWKLRTMAADAAERGLALTVGRDPRVTRVGAWLRRLKLDELPQLLNVLVGEMTFVGPRPEVPCYVALYDAAERRGRGGGPRRTPQAALRVCC